MQGKMKALVKHIKGEGAEIRTVDVPKIEDNEVLVKINAVSICGTDVHIYTWDAWSEGRIKDVPYVFGHEFSGEVVELGSKVKSVCIGDHVSAETHFVCGVCPQCLEGKAHVCKNTEILGVDRQGCFAEYVAIPESNIWKNPKEMPFEVASIQEPFGNAVHTVLSGEVAGRTVAVIGCGPIGVMAVGVAKAAGASQIIAFDLNDYRLDLAKKLGATTVVNSSNENPLEVIDRLTKGNGVDVVCEMSGHPVAMDQAFKMVTNGGRISILSLPAKPVALDVTNDIVFKGITVHGITGRVMYKTWKQVTELISSGQVNLSDVITHTLPMDEFEKGFDLMIKGQCGKVVLIP